MKKQHIFLLLAMLAVLLTCGACLETDSDDGDGNNQDGDQDVGDTGNTYPNGNNNTTQCTGSCTPNTTMCISNATGGYTWCACPATNPVWATQDCAQKCGTNPVLGCADDPNDTLEGKAVCICGSNSGDPVCGNSIVESGETCDGTDLSNCTDGQVCTNCQCQDDVEDVCGDGQITGNEACDPEASPIGCSGDETCTASCQCQGSGPVCGDGTIESPEECDPEASPTGCSGTAICNVQTCTCEGGQTGNGECLSFGSSNECRQTCNAQANTCGTDYQCFGYAGMAQDNSLILGGGRCVFLAQTQQEWDNWMAGLQSCNQNQACPSGYVCLGSSTDGTCFQECNIDSDTCPSGYFPGYENYNMIPWACVAYPLTDGSSVGLCEPWGDAPTCTTPGEACDPNP